jgi:hypothetical protein
MAKKLPTFVREASTTTERLDDIERFLSFFSQELEYAINNIASENLSSELLNRISNIEKTAKAEADTRYEQIAQIANKK